MKYLLNNNSNNLFKNEFQGGLNVIDNKGFKLTIVVVPEDYLQILNVIKIAV